jgi:integrase
MPDEIKAMLDNLSIRERTLVLLAVSTGLRQSELFGLKWGDIDLVQGRMNVTRSIVYGVVGPCKTESSQKPVPVHPLLADALSDWRKQCAYTKLDDWVFASKRHRGRRRERLFDGQLVLHPLQRGGLARNQHRGHDLFPHRAFYRRFVSTKAGAPALRPEVQSLVRSPAMEVPEWRAQEHSYEMQKARDILRNLNATDEERAVAESRLKEND